MCACAAGGSKRSGLSPRAAPCFRPFSSSPRRRGPRHSELFALLHGAELERRGPRRGGEGDPAPAFAALHVEAGVVMPELRTVLCEMPALTLVVEFQRA